MKTIFYILLFLSLNATAQNINTESAEMFWVLHNDLKKDRPLDDSTWLKFRSSFANQKWIDRHNKGWHPNYETGLRKAIEITFRPSLSQKRDSIINLPEPDNFDPKSSSWDYVRMHVKTFNDYFYDNLDEVKSYYKENVNDQYNRLILNQALTMLPKDYEVDQEVLDSVNIYVFSIPGAASSSKEGIFLPISMIYNREHIEPGSLGGHELHHVLRGEFIYEHVDYGSIDEKDFYAAYGMHLLLHEGSADLIGMNYDGFNDWKERFTKGSEEKLEILNQWFAKSLNTDFTVERSEVDKLFNYSGGHNPGFYLAEVIYRNDAKDLIRENIYNPFKFILIYQEMAKKDLKQPFIFSDEAMEYVKMLENKYYME